MNIAVKKHGSYDIMYDRNRLENPLPGYFGEAYWRSRNAVVGDAVGRGSAWFLQTDFGEFVLRRYLRGGWAAKVSHQHYLFTGRSRTRPFREFRILEQLHGMNLPVPAPVAAMIQKSVFVYSGALLTATIPSCRTLADAINGDSSGFSLTADDWDKIGRCIRRFHDAGVWHADLNARNILMDTGGEIFLVDFDRARFTPGRAVAGGRNLARLKRSLLKISKAENKAGLEEYWARLEAAYHG